MKQPVLFVDDDARVLQAFKRRLYKSFAIELADSGEKALDLLSGGKEFAVIVSDQQMPGMKGTEFLKEVSRLSPLSARIMLTGNADRQTAVDSVNECNVFRYLTKPCSPDEVLAAINDAAAYHGSLRAEQELLEQTLAGSAKLLVDILAINDSEAFQKVSILRQIGKQFASFIRHPKAWELDMTIMLSSIGEVMLPPELRTKLNSGETLGKIEMQMVMETPKVARDLLLNIPRMAAVAEAIYYKNKNFDGSGYPMDGVKGDKIPVNSRIFRLLSLIAEQSEDGQVSKEILNTLREETDVIDGELLKLAEKCFLSGSSSDKPTRQTIKVTIERLIPGDHLLQDIVTDSGNLALAANHDLTDALIQKVRQFHKLRPLVEPVRVSRLLPGAAAPQEEVA